MHEKAAAIGTDKLELVPPLVTNVMMGLLQCLPDRDIDLQALGIACDWIK
jgi:hypothetical protein